MIDKCKISACFITKNPTYPSQIMEHVVAVGFGEMLVLTNCDSPHRKQELFAKAKYNCLYYQDDDCIAPIWQLLVQSELGKINCAMKAHHIEVYANSRIALLGWGSIFPKSAIRQLDLYRSRYGEDLLYRRETERIMTWFNYPQNRFDLPIYDLPCAYDADRLSSQPDHYDYIPMVEERCAAIWNELPVEDMVKING